MDPIGRPVRITSISFPNGRTLSEVADIVDREAAQGTTWSFCPRPGSARPATSRSRWTGRRSRRWPPWRQSIGCYLVCPIDRTDGARRLNTSVLMDRAGRVAGCVRQGLPLLVRV